MSHRQDSALAFFSSMLANAPLFLRYRQELSLLGKDIYAHRFKESNRLKIRRRRKMDKKKGLKIGILCVASMLVGSLVTYAALQYLLYVPNVARIGAAYGIQLWDAYNRVTITSFDWGTIMPGHNETTDQLVGVYQYVQVLNTGLSPCWVAWQLNGTLPAGVTLTAFYDKNDYVPWAQNTYIGIDMASDNNPIPSGQGSTWVMWCLTVPVGPSPTTFTFTINLLAADSRNG
jgi:hypothetical protein